MGRKIAERTVAVHGEASGECGIDGEKFRRRFAGLCLRDEEVQVRGGEFREGIADAVSRVSGGEVVLVPDAELDAAARQFADGDGKLLEPFL